MNFSISSSEVRSSPAASRPDGAWRFLLAVLLSGALGLATLWIVTANLRDGFLPLDYAAWRAKSDMVASCALPDTVVIGDSRAAAGFMPSRIPGLANLAMGLVSPIDLYFLSQRILACPQPPKRVVVSVSIPQLEQAPLFWSRNVLFGGLTFENLEEVRRHSRALDDKTIFPQATVGDLDAILNDWMVAHKFPSFYFASLVNGGVVGRLAAHHRLRQAIAQSNGHLLYGTAPGSDGVSIDGAAKEFRAAPILDYYFREMIALYATRGVEVLFVAAPVNDATFRTISPAVARQFADYLAALARDEPNFKLVGAAVRPWDNKWFGDANHLNEGGAERFSAEMARELSSFAAPSRGG
ncbi:hypothetical protein JQ554_06405 [Bradyrhizobium diazoefficiens]|nr:hypothetical protein [Bradyrhizobium diazoefficiens]MBR0963729.1 hypothetical protein [Bradyrhizobium diazoefficiens]MBR0977881.1 hypothetical protein [Bradyrhizobium diazoefficiens]MBR1007391.1 hypothetical protein [Bradyrhizobium diazoefficiens]MBR1012768.1 hypothetical protein [Bradyrhizobium diazoefficiens]MBR1052316.1 hypothetical protein [Bradyrhizobium diazoefficiens]